MREEEEDIILQTRRSNTCKASGWEGAEGTERKLARFGLMNEALKQRRDMAGHSQGLAGPAKQYLGRVLSH